MSLISKIIIGLSILVVFTSQSAVAQGPIGTAEGRLICSRYSAEQLSNNLTDELDKVTVAVTARSQVLLTRQNEWDTKREGSYAENDSKRQAHYDAIMSRISTDLQAEALNDFTSSVESAIESKHQSMKSSRDDFRAGLEETLHTQSQAIKTGLDNFSLDVTAAVAKAAQRCDNGVSETDIEVVLKAELVNMQSSLLVVKGVFETLDNQAEELRGTHQAETAEASKKFDEVFKEARGKLELALKEST